ncbi:MAG: SUF system NifU family Fe-S cluster assembly protein, partial [Candidatus Thermoplasmatota archaeon]|nr:SUF system NifU family Fe-S cluster assembly protein [Candidatus Thermoplasmatota archaeon]
ASIMTDAVKGMTPPEARAAFKQFQALVTGKLDVDVEELGKLAVFSTVSRYPVRIKCASLAWHTLKAALADEEEPVTTE